MLLQITANAFYKLLKKAFEEDNDKTLTILSKLTVSTDWKEFFSLARGENISREHIADRG